MKRIHIIDTSYRIPDAVAKYMGEMADELAQVRGEAERLSEGEKYANAWRRLCFTLGLPCASTQVDVIQRASEWIQKPVVPSP